MSISVNQPCMMDPASIGLSLESGCGPSLGSALLIKPGKQVMKCMNNAHLQLYY